MAAAVLVCGERPAELTIVGELSLDGSVGPVSGVLPIPIDAQQAGKRKARCRCPRGGGGRGDQRLSDGTLWEAGAFLDRGERCREDFSPSAQRVLPTQTGK